MHIDPNLPPVEQGLSGIKPFRSRHSHELVHDVARVPNTMVNIYLVGEPHAASGEWVLVDAGLPGSERLILRAVEERFGPDSRPAAIVLTHGHFDHVGSARQLARRWGVPVYAHIREMPYLTGRESYPPPDPSVGGMMARLSPLYPRGPFSLEGIAEPLPEDGSVPGLPEWRWLYTPGHSPGHVSLFRERDRFLIAGDAFVTVRQESALAVLAQYPRVHGPPAYFTIDWRSARQSVEMLARLRPAIAATGHGIPMVGGRLREELDRLVRDFDQEVPRNGRYVGSPAIADAGGVKYIPPSQLTILSRAAPVLGLAAMAFAAYRLWSR